MWSAQGKERRRQMRSAVLVLAGMALALLLASGVALAGNNVGTNGPDTLRGTNGDDNPLGKRGNDKLFSLNGRDNLLGGPGKDCLVCATRQHRFFAGDKNLLGCPGNDFAWAGKGPDNMVGGEGNDLLSDEGVREFSQDNRFSGGPGVSHLWLDAGYRGEDKGGDWALRRPWDGASSLSNANESPLPKRC
jgi:Ca2+-binding RTX toxin-like protein